MKLLKWRNGVCLELTGSPWRPKKNAKLVDLDLHRVPPISLYGTRSNCYMLARSFPPTHPGKLRVKTRAN